MCCGGLHCTIVFSSSVCPGRSVRVSVATSLISHLLQLAVEVGFDWVLYADEDYVRMSVIPNCELF